MMEPLLWKEAVPRLWKAGLPASKTMEHYPDIQRRDGTLFFVLPETTPRAAIATSIERLIDLLDAMEGDPDLEPYLAGFDHQTSDREDDAGDCPEIEDEHGGNILDEPHDAEDDEPNGDEIDYSCPDDMGFPSSLGTGSGSAIARDMIRGLPIAAKRADAYALVGVPLVYQFVGGHDGR